MTAQPVKIRSLPGIKRDGTVFEGDNYIDGQWCRFQRGLPRKMGGYRRITDTLPQLVRGMSSFSQDTNHYLHLGSSGRISQAVINSLDQLAFLINRTPAGMPTDTNRIWQFATLFNSVSTKSSIIANGPLNYDITSSVESHIYYGDIIAAAALVDTGLPSVSGGICVAAPYLLTYGNAGHVTWTAPLNPTAVQNEAFVTSQKIVYGLPLRGGGIPSVLFWSLDALVRGSRVGGAVQWDFDELTTQSSVLSSSSIIEYDGVYYWWGVDRCLMFNGVVQELPNQMNINYFLDNLNFDAAQRVFAYKVPRFGEIWWCYPRGNATECTHAIIYNVREQTWYDTKLPGTGRTAGIYASAHHRPFMVDRLANTGLWQHEIGTDEVAGFDTQPVPSHFQTSEISMPADSGQDQTLRVSYVEPDFVQSGPLRVTVVGRPNARAPVQTSDSFSFPETPANGTEEIVPLKEVRRLMSFKFESNSLGGDYQMGQTLAHIEPADSRKTT